MLKPKYEIGDYVRIRSDLEVDMENELTPSMVELAGQLVRIINVNIYDVEDMPYEVDKLEGFHWKEEWFEYRLGNYEDDDNIYVDNTIRYIVGYHYDGKRTFNGYVYNYDTDAEKFLFVSDDGHFLALNFDDIDYIIPYNKEN